MDPAVDLHDLLEPAVLSRLQRALAGHDEAKRLRLDALEPGGTGIVEATVVQSESPRTFRRRDGREGTLARVTVRDATGEADLVLWGEQTALVGTLLLPGRHVRLSGVEVRPGYRGAWPELALHGEAVPLEARTGAGAAPGPAGGEELEGQLRLEPTEPVLDGSAPRFRAYGALEDPQGTRRVLLWDDALQEARALAPGPLRLTSMAPHPVLDGLWISTPATKARPAPPQA